MISRVGGAAAPATSVALPSHEAGDLLLAFAYRADVSAPAPALPPGWVSLADDGTGGNGSRVGWRVAASSSEVSGTWAGAQAVIVVIYRCEGRWRTPTVSQDSGSGITMSWPGLAQPPEDGWYVRFCGNRTAGNLQDGTPDGWTDGPGMDTLARSIDSPAATAAQNIGGNEQNGDTTADWQTATIGLSEATPPAIGTARRDLWDKIPAAATVLTLCGQTFNLTDPMPQILRGVFAQPPYTLRQVTYPASLKSTTIADGVAALNTALAAPGPTIVVAHDLGAQVCSRWMREHAADTSPLTDVTFLLAGNPLRSTGGGSLIGATEIGGTIGQPTPTDTPWPVVDIARRWDGVADWPTDTSVAVAVRNATAGKTLHHNYSGVDLWDPGHTVWTVGNTTYLLTAEPALPLLRRMTVPDEVATRVRSAVEAAYSRPESDPQIAPGWTRNLFWNSVFDQLTQ